jgi:hypothetical protein
MTNKNNFPIELDNLDQINKLTQTNKLLTKPKIKINFDDSSTKFFYDFIFEHKNISDLYIGDNYKINIDIIEYNFELYLFFIDCVEKSYDYISRSNFDLKLFGDITIWNFCIVQNVMFNFPFTLANIIYIPIGYIQDNFTNKDYTSLSRTIVHEKIHLGQRYGEEIWNEFINYKDKNWIKINNYDEKFIIINNAITNNKLNLLNSNEEFISNPDSHYENFKYVYKIIDIFYYGHYVYNSNTKKIKIKYFELDIPNKKLKKTSKSLEQEHPYEIFAYAISEEII